MCFSVFHVPVFLNNVCAASRWMKSSYFTTFFLFCLNCARFSKKEGFRFQTGNCVKIGICLPHNHDDLFVSVSRNTTHHGHATTCGSALFLSKLTPYLNWLLLADYWLLVMMLLNRCSKLHAVQDISIVLLFYSFLRHSSYNCALVGAPTYYSKDVFWVSQQSVLMGLWPSINNHGRRSCHRYAPAGRLQPPCIIINPATRLVSDWSKEAKPFQYSYLYRKNLLTKLKQKQ